MRFIIVLIFTFMISPVICQDDRCNVNLIIMVDDDICIGSIANAYIIMENNKKISITYHPGDLRLDKEAMNLLKGSRVSTLHFDYYQYVNGKQTLYNYELPFYSNWLEQDYTVLRVYNLDKRKYRKRFKPLDKKRNYTFELDYPGGSMKRIKNK